MKIVYAIENTARDNTSTYRPIDKLCKDLRSIRHGLWMAKFFAVADINQIIEATNPSIDLHLP